MTSAILTPTPKFLAGCGHRRRSSALSPRPATAKLEVEGCGELRIIGEQYKRMLGLDPSNPLLLMNYGKYLHEVECDVKGAQEYYGRAILAGPGDGEVFSLYGRLVWESEKDEERAGVYFERAVEASPDDCHVLGSYAHFLWDSEKVEDERNVSTAQPLVEAFKSDYVSASGRSRPSDVHYN